MTTTDWLARNTRTDTDRLLSTALLLVRLEWTLTALLALESLKAAWLALILTRIGLKPA